ncbi:transcriptional regulator, XRE family [Kribbella flavida DSM 17836]|uniref:Transcriptional regulator, XRE family n=1 Tax=Kribbella flavida (strain DSM 17836 / JCM 10339 / NBRC 14399) TaxID=479435 RepID=D2PUG4_KRIFD|nr:helix-turn-helix transcriptional regulator [Kribbella flavida]ADB29482.1 transcriptional regulator, XRE family [Kribbella flavida DSM 17836]
MELGPEFRARRKAAGRTIASVAVDAGLSVPYIANLENGRGNPTLATLDRLATALGTHLRVELENLPTHADTTNPDTAPATGTGTNAAADASGGGAYAANAPTVDEPSHAVAAANRANADRVGDAATAGGAGIRANADRVGNAATAGGAGNGANAAGAAVDAASAVDPCAALLAASPRTAQVIDRLAVASNRPRSAIQGDLLTTLQALAVILPTTPTPTDLDRLLDLLLLSTT